MHRGSRAAFDRATRRGPDGHLDVILGKDADRATRLTLIAGYVHRIHHRRSENDDFAGYAARQIFVGARSIQPQADFACASLGAAARAASIMVSARR